MIAEDLYPLLSFVPAGVLAMAVKVWRWLRRDGGLRPPTEEKYLPSAGDSCLRKIEELDDKLGDLIIYLLVMPPLLALWFIAVRKSLHLNSVWSWAPSAMLLTACFLWLCCRFFILAKKRADYRLGFTGERLVGQELNKLMLEGCQVFHDFPLAKNWNLDHIVVAPSGVFAIETKMRRKGPRTGRQKAHEVIFDGKALQFPRYEDTASLEQARKQAARLAELLNGELAGAAVKPVVTLPGWYVMSQGAGDVLVLNPKMLDSAILGGAAAALSAEQIAKIARRLEQEFRRQDC